MPAEYTEDEIKKAHEILYNEGLKMRSKVASPEYVEAAVGRAKGTFAEAMQQYVTEACWGSVWTRPGLPLKTRSFLNIAILCNQNRSTELATHIKGALTNGATEEEICEVILHTSSYCGMPSGIEGFRVAQKTIEEWKTQRQQQSHASSEHLDVDVAERVKPEQV
ncbi:hypothetical protein AMS68_006849 [Peltaster fructicola]|uniref:Carboxymuconolactone decarboxylase-like domain-containing protein n=1 Tax=Peltaster fructicola TaxID=286661 RepID=A0A6H0Y2T6_9PEZI|nr:hypothetical protein AMS68_006849 [Peltaster fructicola]